ncbi:MAG: FAD-dependent oxidoreductase [Bacteroidota bacterium]
MNFDIIIIGAGVFGTTTAIELSRRGYHTALLDPGPLPHPLAASTDISKVIRMEYGTDEQYMEMVEQCMPIWRAWNKVFDRPLFHEVGVAMFTQNVMAPGGFEYESFKTLNKRGHKPERLNADEIHTRFPAWKHGRYVDGFYHAIGGFAESGQVVTQLVKWAKNEGVHLEGECKIDEILEQKGRITGVKSTIGQIFNAKTVVVAAGAWTPVLLPELGPMMRVSGHPVFHLKPQNPGLFQFSNFPVFTADVARTGWYGFPVHPVDGVIKVSNHGIGLTIHPENDAREVTADDEAKLRNYLKTSFPGLANAPVASTRRCLYCDTLDEHFLIDHHPEKQGLVVASGGSGHGFKFAPILGSLIADCIESKKNPWLPKFQWRNLQPGTKGEEAARFHG